MRPSEPYIPVPPWPPGTEWVGGPVPAMEAVTSRKPALVHFLDVAQLNSMRSLPYLEEWSSRYQPMGLAVYGVHTPRWPLTEDPGSAREAIERLALPHPVAIDSNRAIWRDYGCHGWPHSFLWKQGGWLAWSQLGEGDYPALEGAIREVLEDAERGPDGDWPELVPPMRESDSPGAELVAPTEEMLIGGSLETPWVADREGAAIEAVYQGAGAYASLGGEGTVRFQIDGGDQHQAEISGPELLELSSHDRSGEHELILYPGPGIEIYSLSFAPGLA